MTKRRPSRRAALTNSELGLEMVTHAMRKQVSCLKQCFCCFERRRPLYHHHGKDTTESRAEVEDKSAEHLSYVGRAAFDALRKYHFLYHHRLWNVTTGRVVGELHQTPRTQWKADTDPPPNNDDWFPEKMGEILSRTEVWCDVMSLGPPEGLFMVEMKRGLAAVAERSRGRDPEEGPIVVRMMFGNIVGMPVNCDAIMKGLTEDLPADSNMHLWVGPAVIHISYAANSFALPSAGAGAWRKGVSWNHAKIIAVDGRYLHTGGHNLWDQHYLEKNPVHDLSLELEGRIAHDGHMFANEQWLFVELNQRTCCGQIINRLPDSMPMLMQTRVTISEWPVGKAKEYAPRYRKQDMPLPREPIEGGVPIVSMGRYGAIVPVMRPSDAAFIAIITSAKTIVRLALQDLGPVCVPGTKFALPGCVWPDDYLRAFGRIIWEKEVDVEIALSNPNSIPGDLKATDANYGNGWSCVDVAAEIIKTVRAQFPDADDAGLRRKVAENLRVCFIRERRGPAWEDGKTMGMHAKHFIVDDRATYIGSQNLYVCDLAEWGILIDDEATTQRIMDEYWRPMWESSFTGEDCDVQSVMDGLDIDRTAQPTYNPLHRKSMMMAAARQQALSPGMVAANLYTKEAKEDRRTESALDYARKSIMHSTTASLQEAAPRAASPKANAEEEAEDVDDDEEEEKNNE